MTHVTGGLGPLLEIDEDDEGVGFDDPDEIDVDLDDLDLDEIDEDDEIDDED